MTSKMPLPLTLYEPVHLPVLDNDKAESLCHWKAVPLGLVLTYLRGR